MKANRLLLPLGILIFCLYAETLQAQIDPEVLQRARAAGITPEQIEAIFQKIPEETLNTAASQQDSHREVNRFSPSQARLHSAEQNDSLRGPLIFGQDIFRRTNLSFISDYHIPTPAHYVLGAGDEVIIDVWGASEMNFRGKITPEGHLFVSGIPIQLSGYRIDEATQKIRTELRPLIGGLGNTSQMKVTLGEIRSVNIHIVGDVNEPGTYTLPALATVLNALYLAGGPNDIGSLREIRLTRKNEVISQVDLYETLIHGKTESNVRLEEGDVILVPPYRSRVLVNGEIKRESGYELKSDETLADLLLYSGGLKSEAYRENLTVHRKSGRQYQIHTVPKTNFGSFAMQDGDSVYVDKIIDLYANRLTIRGAVWRPGEYEFSPELNRLSRLIAKAENLKGNEFADRGQIIRLRPDFMTEIIPFSVSEVVRGETDIELRPEDEVYIPATDQMTERRYIIVRGEVNRPDTLDFRYNMTIEDAILGAGGLKESASLAQAAVARRIKNPQAETYSGQLAETFSFDIQADLSLLPDQAGFTLHPFDEVYIRRSPVYFTQQGAVIAGEILFEGNYAFSRVGERLSELIAKAGGVTPEAYTKGASLTRTMTLDEKAKVEAKLAMANANLGKDSVDVHALNITNTYPVGIDLEKALRNPGGSDDIVLRDGDVVYIPKLDNTIKISGSVLYANTVTFEGERLNDYISQAGGYTDAARRRPFIVYMNGKIASTRRGFLHKRYPRVEPGCEIIVPEKAERNNRFGVLDAMNIASSSTAIAAMIATILK